MAPKDSVSTSRVRSTRLNRWLGMSESLLHLPRAFSTIDMANGREVEVAVGHKAARVVVAEDGGLELWLQGCLRKRREPSLREPLYVWTNVELYWEEHRYVEVRYWPGAGRLEVTVNGELVAEV